MSGLITAAGITAAATLGSAAMSSGMLGGKGGGAGGAGGPAQQQQLPEWINNGLMQNYGAATTWSHDMPGPYEGDRVANLSPEMQSLIAQQYGFVGSTNPYYDTALQKTNALSGFARDPLTQQRLAGTDLSPYMNPYTQGVINPAMQQMEQARRQALMGIGDQATQAKAFGGSRQGIAEGVTNAQSELQKGGFVSNLMGQNFLNAQQQAIGDITRQYQTQVANRGQQLGDAEFQARMAQQYGALAGSRQSNFLNGIEAAMRGQAVGYDQQQKEFDAAKALYEEQRMDPLQRIQMRQAFLTNNPAANTGGTYSQGPQTSSNPFMTGLGAASTTAGLLGQLSKIDWGGGGSGVSPISPSAAMTAYNSMPASYTNPGFG